MVSTVAWLAEVLPRKPEDPLNVAEMLREPSSVPGKVTFVWATPEPSTATPEARMVPLPAVVPVLS